MTMRFYDLHQLPSKLPIWQLILDDLGNPPPKRIAKALEISERTAYRYNQAGHAPKAVSLALFWLTRWGRSQINERAVWDAQEAVGFVDCLRREVQRLTDENTRLMALGHFGSANEPILKGVLNVSDR